MNCKKIIKIILVFIVTYLLLFYVTEYTTKKYIKDRFYSNNWLLTYPLDIELNKGNCELIKTYSEIKIEYSPIKNNNLDKIKSLYKNCSEFNLDLKYLNSIDMVSPNYFYKDEKNFLYCSIKYYYYLDKNYLLKEINNNNFNSEIALLLKEKINIENKSNLNIDVGK